MNKTTTIILFILASLSAQTIKAETNWRTLEADTTIVPGNSVAGFSTTSHALTLGATNILDTYISPENYTGTELRYIFESSRLKEGKLWERQLRLEISTSTQQARSKQCDDLAAMLRLQYGFVRHFQTSVNGLTLKAGGQSTFNLGGLYNTRNGNNPAQARIGLNVGPAVGVKYDFSLFSRSFSLNYQASMPLLGLQFSPNYGQSYYEIFTKGNYDRNIVPTTFFATPSLRQALTLDFPLGKKTLRIGYLGDYDQASLNNLKYHSYTHALLIGVVLNK